MALIAADRPSLSTRFSAGRWPASLWRHLLFAFGGWALLPSVGQRFRSSMGLVGRSRFSGCISPTCCRPQRRVSRLAQCSRRD